MTERKRSGAKQVTTAVHATRAASAEMTRCAVSLICAAPVQLNPPSCRGCSFRWPLDGYLLSRAQMDGGGVDHLIPDSGAAPTDLQIAGACPSD